jgi:hypothetical protein
MTGTRGPLDQLDVPLVWDRTLTDAQPRLPERAPRQSPHAASWSRARLWVASLADLGVVLLALAASWGVAAASGTTLAPLQLVVAGLAGILLGAVLGVGALWGWRATPGMALLHLRFAAPLTLAQGQRLWLGWLVSLLLVGVPLLVGRRGRTVAERLGGSELTLRSRGAAV